MWISFFQVVITENIFLLSPSLSHLDIGCKVSVDYADCTDPERELHTVSCTCTWTKQLWRKTRELQFNQWNIALNFTMAENCCHKFAVYHHRHEFLWSNLYFSTGSNSTPQTWLTNTKSSSFCIQIILWSEIWMRVAIMSLQRSRLWRFHPSFNCVKADFGDAEKQSVCVVFTEGICNWAPR